MTVYDVYVESGPRRKKTMVHVLALLGCIANGPTTEDALAATPDAIRAFRRFLARHGAAVDRDDAVETRIAEHITEGDWLGNGSPYLIFAPEREAITDGEVRTLLERFRWMREDLATWVASRSDAELDAAPPDGDRAARAIVLHILAVPGAYLAAALGGTTGFSRLGTRAERGEAPLPAALLQVVDMVAERVWVATPAERSAVVERPKDVRTLRKALRRMLEHDWEHIAELARRPGGPDLAGG